MVVDEAWAGSGNRDQNGHAIGQARGAAGPAD